MNFSEFQDKWLRLHQKEEHITLDDFSSWLDCKTGFCIGCFIEGLIKFTGGMPQ